MIGFNDWNYTDINANLQSVDVSSVMCLLNIHTLPQYNESSPLNEININAINGDFNVGYCYRNSSTEYEWKNQNSIYYTNKGDESSTNRYLMDNNVLPGGVGIYVLLPAYALNQYSNM